MVDVTTVAVADRRVRSQEVPALNCGELSQLKISENHFQLENLEDQLVDGGHFDFEFTGLGPA